MSVVDVVDVKQRMEKIRSTGYWRVNIRPTKFEEFRIGSLDRCWELMESCRVYLRGWDYPAVSEKEKSFGEGWIQSGADFRSMVELWRFYQSGQFIHYFSCMEDYRMNEVPRMFRPKKGSRGLGILSTLYRGTEIFEFAARLAQKEVLWPRLQISIKLAGMKERELFYAERISTDIYVCQNNEISLRREFSAAEIIAEGDAGALNAISEIFEHFGWQNSPRRIFVDVQRRFLEGSLKTMPSGFSWKPSSFLEDK